MTALRQEWLEEAPFYPNDPLFPSQWYLHNTGQTGGKIGADIKALDAWQISRGSPDIVIAVLDTGVDLDHPDLASKLVPGATFVPGTESADDDHGHGTQMAGVAAAGTDNGEGIAGVCPEARIMPIKVATAKGNTDDADGNVCVAEGIRWAVDHGAHVINMSIAMPDTPAMRAAIDYAYERGVLIVAAAGGSGTDFSPFPAPAYLPHVLAVGGTDNRDRRWAHSSFGMEHLVLAPAIDVVSPVAGGGYALGQFTSIATAQVAGLAALVRSIRPDLSVDAIIAVIELGADLVHGQKAHNRIEGYGRINCYRSLCLALDF